MPFNSNIFPISLVLFHGLLFFNKLLYEDAFFKRLLALFLKDLLGCMRTTVSNRSVSYKPNEKVIYFVPPDAI